MKITYSKSEPYKSGWKGWADWVDVFVDGKKIGMEYTFTDELKVDGDRSGYNIRINEFGLKAAKAKLQAALAERLALQD